MKTVWFQRVNVPFSCSPHGVTYVSNYWGLFTWNNQRLLNFEAGVLDRAAPASVVIWWRGVRGSRWPWQTVTYPAERGGQRTLGKTTETKGRGGGSSARGALLPHGKCIIQIKSWHKRRGIFPAPALSPQPARSHWRGTAVAPDLEPTVHSHLGNDNHSLQGYDITPKRWWWGGGGRRGGWRWEGASLTLQNLGSIPVDATAFSSFQPRGRTQENPAQFPSRSQRSGRSRPGVREWCSQQVPTSERKPRARAKGDGEESVRAEKTPRQSSERRPTTGEHAHALFIQPLQLFSTSSMIRVQNIDFLGVSCKKNINFIEKHIFDNYPALQEYSRLWRELFCIWSPNFSSWFKGCFI